MDMENPLKMCEQCNGIVLLQSDLTKFLEKFAADMVQNIDVDAEIPESDVIAAQIPCPQCGLTMENYGYMGSKSVLIDSCFRCRTLWLDQDDLYAMAVLYARTNLRQDIEFKKRHDEAIADNRVFDQVVKQYQDYVRKGFFRGFRGGL